MDKKQYEQPQVTTETICQGSYILAGSLDVYDDIPTEMQFSRSDDFTWIE